MENWIGAGIWIVMGASIGLAMKMAVKLPEEAPGHSVLLAVLGAFGAVVGGMLGVGIFEFSDPVAMSTGGMGSAAVFAGFISLVYRWGIKSLT